MPTIVCNDGMIEEMYYDKLLKEYNKNEEVFEQKYIGAKISFVGIPIGNGLNSFNDGKKYRSLIFGEGWRVEILYEGHEFIDKADEEGRLIMLSVESYISAVVEYEKGKPQIVLGSWDENDVGRIIEIMPVL